MEALKLKRTPLRSAFTKTFNLCKENLEKVEPDVSAVDIVLEQLTEKANRLKLIDDEILDTLLKNGASEEDYNKEFEACEVYTERLINCKAKLKQLKSAKSKETVQFISNVEDAKNVESRITQMGLKLPKINLIQFDRDPRSWLNFWNTFSKIHEDPILDDHSKFVYLIQATAPKSKAREIVQSFPTTKENYPKVIDHFKNRFGREDMLIQVYVRDLLQLVLSNNSASSKDFNL